MREEEGEGGKSPSKDGAWGGLSDSSEQKEKRENRHPNPRVLKEKKEKTSLPRQMRGGKGKKKGLSRGAGSRKRRKRS